MKPPTPFFSDHAPREGDLNPCVRRLFDDSPVERLRSSAVAVTEFTSFQDLKIDAQTAIALFKLALIEENHSESLDQLKQVSIAAVVEARTPGSCALHLPSHPC